MAQELETYTQCTGGSRGFCKEDESLEDEKHCGWPFEGDSNQLKESSELILTQEVAEELNLNHSMVIQHLKQSGKVKKLDKWVHHELTKILKIIILKCHFLLFYAIATNHFLIVL